MRPSYWSEESLIVRVRSGDSTQETVIAQPLALVGSHPDCDLVLDEPRIEKRSLVVLVAPLAIYGVVLHATAKRAGRIFPIEAMRGLKLGACEVTVTRSGGGTTSTVAQPADHENELSVSLLTWKTRGQRYHAQLPSQRPILLGRRAPSLVTVQDDSLSGVHACLYRDGSRLWIRDLCSTNGTSVRGKSVSLAQLENGRSFRAGNTRFHFLELHTDQAVNAIQAQHAALQIRFDVAERHWQQHRGLLLKALAELTDRGDEAQQQWEEQAQWLLARISELEAFVHDLSAERDRLRLELRDVQSQSQVLSSELEDERAARVTSERAGDAQREDFEERDRILKHAEAELTARELSLLAQRTEFRRERQAFERRRRDMALAGLTDDNPLTLRSRHERHDETCISSPHFSRILSEAIKSHEDSGEP